MSATMTIASNSLYVPSLTIVLFYKNKIWPQWHPTKNLELELKMLQFAMLQKIYIFVWKLQAFNLKLVLERNTPSLTSLVPRPFSHPPKIKISISNAMQNSKHLIFVYATTWSWTKLVYKCVEEF